MNPKEPLRAVNRTARTAGALYLVMLVVSMLCAVFFTKGLVVPGDAAATAAQIGASAGLFRLGIAGNLFVQVIHIFLVIVLYRLLRPVNPRTAMFLAVLGLVSVPIAMLNETNQFAALILSGGETYAAALGAGQLNAIMGLFLELHEYGILIAQIFWGLWLFPLGYLICKSGYIPKVLGFLLIIGGAGYVIDAVMVFLFPGIDIAISMFTFWGEVLLPLWLLIKGVNAERWEKSVPDPA